MKNKFLHFLAILLLLLTFQSASAIEPKVVKVGSFQNYPVIFKDTDGLTKGLYVDLLTEIGAKENIHFEYVFGTWNDGLERIKTGEVDMLTSVGYTEERVSLMDYTQNHILTVWGDLYTLKSSKLSSILEVSDKKIGVMKGDINSINFQNLTSRFGINCEFIEFIGYDEVFSAVADGTVDVGIAGITFGATNQKKYGLKSTGIVFNPLNLYFTVAKEKNQELVTVLDKYLTVWKNQENSFLKQTEQKWIYGSVGAIAVTPSWVVSALSMSVIIILIAVLFITILRLQVRRAIGKIKQKEESLAQTNELFSLFMRYSPVYTFIKEVTPTESRVLQASDNFIKMIGASGPNIIGKTMSEIFPLELAKKMTSDDWSVVSGGKVLVIDEEFNGRKYTTIKFPIKKEGKNLLAGYTTDVTEEREKEELLAEKNRQMSTLLSNLYGMAYRCKNEKDWTMEFVSDGVLALTGYSSSDLVNNNKISYRELIHPEDRTNVWDKIQSSIGKKESFEIIYRIKTAEGQIKWVRELGRGVFSGAGELICLEGFISDVTAQQNNENELHKKMLENKLIVDNANSVIIKWTPDGIVSYVNEKGLKIFGYSKEEFIGKNIEIIVPKIESSGRDISTLVNDVVKHPDKYLLVENENIKKNGERLWMVWSNSAIKDEGGQIKGIITVGNDLTPRKNLEDELKKERDLAKNLLDIAGVIIISLDKEGNISLINKKGCEVLEYASASELIGKNWFELFLPEKDKSNVREYFSNIMSRKTEMVSYFENFIITKNGKERYVAFYNTPLYDSESKIYGVLSSGEDITERKLIEKQLVDSRADLGLALSSGNMGVWKFDIVSGKRIFDNQTCLLLGLNPALFKGSKEEFYQIVHPDDRERIRKSLDDSIRSGQAYEERYRVIWPDRSVKWVSVRGEIFHNNGNKIINGILWDVTESQALMSELTNYKENLEKIVKERTEELNKEKIRAEASNIAKSNFLANMSHEIRTPLTAIIGFTQMVKDKILGPINETQEESLRDVLISSKHLLSIIDDILDISSVESGKMKTYISELHPENLIKNINVMMLDSIKNKKIKFSTFFDPNIKIIKSDERKVKQILFNLISNAIKFTPEGGSIDLSIKNNLDDKTKVPDELRTKINFENSIFFSVKDSGVGIEEANNGDVFEKFVQIEQPLTKKHSGVGLGLPLSRELAKILGGEIWFESAGKDKGTTFFFVLPVVNGK